MKLNIIFRPVKFKIKLQSNRLIVHFKNPVIRDGTSLEPYIGDYTITPKIAEQKIETNGLRMIDDITILEIPYYKTTNLSGGYTAIIGG